VESVGWVISTGDKLFTDLEFHRLLENRPGEGEGMEFAVLAARINFRRQRSDETSIKVPPTASSPR